MASAPSSSSSSSGLDGGARGVASTAAAPAAKPVKRVYAYAHGTVVDSETPTVPKTIELIPESTHYTHTQTGFLSDERSYKGTHFARIMAEDWGQRLQLLNLNGPSGKPEGTYVAWLSVCVCVGC